ncbi:MAG: phosphoglycerate kinase [Deltaproteobacteria bacterium]|nr:phosphoglycerate kinase [Deltaproteobacteria bacterium]
MKFIDELDIAGKRVFLRADLSVPLEAGKVADDHRIRATIPTIEYALKKGASVILCSHLDRPKGRDMKYSLAPVADRLRELLKAEVALAPDCVGEEIERLSKVLRPGEVLLLENVRFHAEEEANDPAFAEQLSKLGDVYVNDAFATAHRKHASTAGITKFFSVKGGGFTMKDELSYFHRAFNDPKRPLVAIFGGAKVSTKMAAIRAVGERADKVLIGGAMANTFFAAAGYNVGKSLFEPEEVDNARDIQSKMGSAKLLLPTDVVVASELKSGIPTKTVAVTEIPAEQMALDVGPQTVAQFREAIRGAATILWNGPMGAFETEEFASGTYAIVDALSESEALTVVGGGDTDLALHRRHAFEKMSYVSTAGGAFLKLLEGGSLAAVKALE